MVVLPANIPVTVPEEISTVPYAGKLLLHVPPAAPLLNVVLVFSHITAVPAIGEGNGLTVTVAVRKQPVPVPIVYVRVAIFADTPVTTPVVLTTEPIDGSLLLHMPPAGPLVKVVVKS